MTEQDAQRVIRGEVVVDGGVDAVWDAWTTAGGVRSFFAPDCKVELRVDGPYEMFFDLEAPPGKRGGEGMRILAFQPGRMLSFTWNAPPDLPNVRGHKTHVVVRMQPIDSGRTRVILTHDGWGEGEEWDKAFAYFTRAWTEIVLPRLVRRFADGPIEWKA